MELNINQPMYYKDHYGIDDNINRYCQDLYYYFKDKNYSEVLQTVGIIPILAPEELYERGEWKEHVSMISANSVATIYIRMNLEKYLMADELEKRYMYLEMIIKAMKKVKSKGKFNIESFCNDIEVFTNPVCTTETLL